MGTTAQNSDHTAKTITFMVPAAKHPIVHTQMMEPGSSYFETREEPAVVSASDFETGIDAHLDVVCAFSLSLSFFYCRLV